MLFPQSQPARVFAGMVTGFAFGIPMGLFMYRALAPLEPRGRVVTLLVRWWSWFVGLGTLMGLTVGIGGPYVFAGPLRGGGYDSDPVNRHELLWALALQALLYTLISMWQDRARLRRLRQQEARGDGSARTDGQRSKPDGS